jgi:hypothetical protein
MSAQTAAVLDAARDLVVRDGWRQGIRPEDAAVTDRRRCPLVAIATADKALLAKNGRTRFFDAADAFRAVIPDKSVTRWNDGDGRTEQEVLDAFTTAADRERGAA